ncbi:MAG: DUF1643 domain-containing protein [Muribaculaceae bacterium]|nr:DUF1643 domain-containing protein [Muribaculaceae bacterium]
MEYTNISMIGDQNVRYVLKKVGQNPLIVLGVNPSTADDVTSDRTMTRVCGFADKMGFDSFVMLNVYPLRSTKIEELPAELNPDLHQKNLLYITDEISKIDNPTILVAHGNSISKKKYLRSCLQDILKELAQFKTAKFIQLGDLTNEGNPRHPLMARGDIEIKEYKF